MTPAQSSVLMPSRAFIDSDRIQEWGIEYRTPSVLMPSRAFIDSDLLKKTVPALNATNPS